MENTQVNLLVSGLLVLGVGIWVLVVLVKLVQTMVLESGTPSLRDLPRFSVSRLGLFLIGAFLFSAAISILGTSSIFQALTFSN